MKKIIMTINQFEQNLYFDLLFVKQSLTKAVVEKKEAYYYFNNNLDFNDDLSKVTSDLKNLFITNNYQKAKIIVNLNLAGFFIEEIGLPLLSIGEEKKALDLELEKLYPNYQKRFIRSSFSYLHQRQIKKNRVLFYKIDQYYALLQFLKKLKQTIISIRFAPDALVQAINKLHLVDNKEPFIFINVSSENTMILVYQKRLLSYHLVFEGLKGLEEDAFEQVDAFIKNLKAELLKVLYFQDNNKFVNIYFYSEFDHDNLYVKFTSDLNIKIKKVMSDSPLLPYISSIGAIYNANGRSFKLPLVVKLPKEKAKKGIK